MGLNVSPISWKKVEGWKSWKMFQNMLSQNNDLTTIITFGKTLHFQIMPIFYTKWPWINKFYFESKKIINSTKSYFEAKVMFSARLVQPLCGRSCLIILRLDMSNWFAAAARSVSRPDVVRGRACLGAFISCWSGRK